jgi:hypothetical protein
MGSPHHNGHSRSMPRPYKCRICGKSYAVDYAKNNHEKLCEERK